MGGKEHLQSAPQSLAEEEVARLGGVRARENRTGLVSADLLQCARDATRVAGELDGRRVREELPLPAHGSLDEVAEERPEETDHHQAQSRRDDRHAAAVAAVAAPTGSRVERRAQQEVADDADDQDPVDHAHQPDVEPHVSAEDMAELVRDDSLEFIATEPLYATSRDTDDGIARRKSRGECVDALFVFEQIDGRRRDARRNGHFLHDVEQPAFVCVAGARRDQRSSERLRDHGASASQLGDLVEASAPHHDDRGDCDAESEIGLPPQWRDHHLPGVRIRLFHTGQ